MCNIECIKFGQKHLIENRIKNKRIIELGSRYVGGSVKEYAIEHNPSEYIGCDIVKGKNVDVICNVESILNKFGIESFDMVITTEMLEHVKNWKLAINNMKSILKLNGYLLLTTRSKGFKKHGYPNDYWRFEVDDMKYIFSDFEIIDIDIDNKAPGVFIMVKKPLNYKMLDLTDKEVYKIK